MALREQALTWVVDKNRESEECCVPVKFSVYCRNDLHCSEHLQLCKCKHCSERPSFEAGLTGRNKDAQSSGLCA